MSDFLNSIRITDEEKKKAISKILFSVMHASTILSLNEIIQNLKETEELGVDIEDKGKQIKEKLTQHEMLAAYSLAKEIKISMMNSSHNNKKLFNYLELNLGSVNEDNLFKFTNEIVKDIEYTKRNTPNANWSLQIGKIFSRLEGKNPYSEQDSTKDKQDNSDKANKIIDLSEYLEK